MRVEASADEMGASGFWLWLRASGFGSEFSALEFRVWVGLGIDGEGGGL